MKNLKNVKTFSIGSIYFSDKYKESDEFFYGRMCVLSTRPNSHRLVISSEVLKRDGETVRGKWVVAKPEMGDFMNHTPQEYIVGIIPENAQIDFVDDEDGETYMYVDVVLSKIYADKLYDWFIDHPKTDVSVEMQTKETTVSGVEVVDELNILGVTVLGSFVNGSCPDATIEITRFSENAKNYYDEMVNFSQDESNKEIDNMSEENKDIIMDESKETLAEENKEQKVEMSATEDKEEMSDKGEETKSEGEDNKSEEMSKDKSEEMSDENKDMACGEKMSETDKVEEKDDEDVDKEEEDMSFCGTFKLSEFSEDVADTVKTFCELSAKEVVEKLIKMSNEISSLTKFKEETEAKDKFAKLSSIMASVKCDLNEDDYKKFSEEGEKLSITELSGFENKVKAFAYENSKKNKKDNNSEIMTFAGTDTSLSEKKELTADDIFNKYL